jgi:SHS2 domain-containing protein
MLLFELLQELVFRKDAEGVLLRVADLRIRETPGGWALEADALGETIDPRRHDLAVDVKAVTLHRFKLTQEEGGWRATVILDV